MMQTYFILDSGGLMTGQVLQQHNGTIKHYNRLVDVLQTIRTGTTEYIKVVNKLNHLKAYIERDLQTASKTADKLMKN
jgi:hypothetical protein